MWVRIPPPVIMSGADRDPRLDRGLSAAGGMDRSCTDLAAGPGPGQPVG